MDYQKFFQGNDHSVNYTKFRPKTPQQILEWILEYLSEKMIKTDDGGFSIAADIGCGTGNYFNEFRCLV